MMLEKPPSVTAEDEMLARAEAAIAGLREAYRAQLAEDVAHFFAMWSDYEAGGDLPALLKRIYALAHDVKGQGGSFGYGLASQIGASLCAHVRQMQSMECDAAKPGVLHLHFRMLRLVSAHDLAGEGGESGARFRRKLAQLAL